MTPVSIAPDDFRLALPASWERIDLDPRTRRESISRLVRQRLGDDPERAAFRREVTAMASKAVEEADATGAEAAWFLADEIGGRPVMATLLVTVWQSDHRDPSVDGIVQRLGRSSRPDNVVLRADTIEVAAGRAARIRRRVKTPRPETNGREVSAEAFQYYVPVPGTDTFLVLGFATPNVTLADAFGELFDAIAGTLQWQRES